MVLVTTKYARLVLLCVLLIAVALSASASVVTVTPSSPGDWSWYLWKGDPTVTAPHPRGYFTAGGPAPADGNPAPTGNGAFYAYITYNGENDGSLTDSVWLGLDRHNNQALAGVKLGKIASMEYTTYNGGVYVINYNGNGNPRRYTAQPFQLNIAAKSPLTGDTRLFIYRPWGLNGWPHWNLRRAWITNDAWAGTCTPNFGLEFPASGWAEVWTGKTFASWSDLLNWDSGNGRGPYSGWELTTTGVNAPWNPDPRMTGTGKPINFEIGVRRSFSAPPYAGLYESAGAQASIDTFTLGIDYSTSGDPNIVETTYDFAAETPAPRLVAVCNIGQSRWKASPPSGFPYASVTTMQDDQDRFIYRWFGRVQDMSYWDEYAPWSSPTRQMGPGSDIDTHEFFFTIWDGSYAKVSDACTEPWAKQGLVRVRLAYQESPPLLSPLPSSPPYSDPATWPVQPGDFVCVQGYLHSPFYFQARPPTEITGRIVANYSR